MRRVRRWAGATCALAALAGFSSWALARYGAADVALALANWMSLCAP